jgi:hypothetical protein
MVTPTGVGVWAFGGEKTQILTFQQTPGSKLMFVVASDLPRTAKID